MYKNVRLEKGLYHIAGKSFTETLEGMDPSEEYRGTSLEGLDAYERQLKRFDIHVCGPHCDRVEKFFSTTESAVLFPEFIRRAIYGGVEQSPLSDVMAVHTRVESGEYMGGVLTDETSYQTTTAQGVDLPTATYLEADTVLTLDKYGRSIHASYEALRRQRLDAFGAVLRAVGLRLSNAILVDATEKMLAQAASIISPATSGTLVYSDLTQLYAAFDEFDMTMILTGPENAALIMAMDQMKEMASTQPNRIMLPFGAQLCKCAGMDEASIIGLDARFAMEMVSGGDLLLETDKIIDSQLDVITASVRVGFRPMMTAAIHALVL